MSRLTDYHSMLIRDMERRNRPNPRPKPEPVDFDKALADFQQEMEKARAVPGMEVPEAVPSKPLGQGAGAAPQEAMAATEEPDAGFTGRAGRATPAEVRTRRDEGMRRFHDISESAMRFAAKLPLNITRGTMAGIDNALGLFTDFETEALVQEVSPSYSGYMQSIEDALGDPGWDDEMIRELASWGVGFGGFLAGLKALSGVQKATFGQALAAEIGAAFTTLDPHIDRMSSALKEFGLENDLIEYLASPGKTEVEDRFKNAVEGAGLAAGPAAVLVGGARALKEAYRLGRDISRAAPEERMVPRAERAPETAPAQEGDG